MKIMMKNKCPGFTLIELLIVILIISIVSSVAALTVHFNRNKQLETLAKTLTNQITLAEEEAMLRPATLGLAFTESAFKFYIFQEIDNTWQPIKNKVFRIQSIPEKTKITLKISGKIIPADGNPQLIISPSGETPPFIIFIGNAEQQPLYQVIGEANGNVYAK